jgi:hypothetical protein
LSESTQRFALHNIELRKYHFHPAHLIQISLEFNTKLLFGTAFTRLTQLPFCDLTPEHKIMIGVAVFQAVAEVKEVLEKHK